MTDMYLSCMKNKESYFEEEQVQKILDYYYSTDEMETYLLFLILYRTGRRISEILGKPPYTIDRKRTISNYKGLRPCDLYDKQEAINFEILKKRPIKQKTSKGTIRSQEKLSTMRLKKEPQRVLIAVDSELYAIIKNYIKLFNIGYEDRIIQMSRHNANLKLKKAVKECGIKMNLGKKNIRNRLTGFIQEVQVQPHLHMFRHTFAIKLLKENKDNPAVFSMLNNILQHSSLNMTMHYTQFQQKDKTELLNSTFKVEQE